MQTKEFSNKEHTIVVRTNSEASVNKLTKDFEEVGNGTMKKVLQNHKPKAAGLYSIQYISDALKYISRSGCRYVRIGFSSPATSERAIILKTEIKDPERQVKVIIAPILREDW